MNSTRFLLVNPHLSADYILGLLAEADAAGRYCTAHLGPRPKAATKKPGLPLSVQRHLKRMTIDLTTALTTELILSAINFSAVLYIYIFLNLH